MNNKISSAAVRELDRRFSLSDREILIIKEAVRASLSVDRAGKTAIPVTGFWLRNVRDGFIEVLVQHDGKWITVFGPDGPGPAARDLDQNIDHMIHAGGVRNLIEHGCLHPPIKGRKVGKADRRDGGDRRGSKRRTGDKLKARLAVRKR